MVSVIVSAGLWLTECWSVKKVRLNLKRIQAGGWGPETKYNWYAIKVT